MVRAPAVPDCIQHRLLLTTAGERLLRQAHVLHRDDLPVVPFRLGVEEAHQGQVFLVLARVLGVGVVRLLALEQHDEIELARVAVQLVDIRGDPAGDLPRLLPGHLGLHGPLHAGLDPQTGDRAVHRAAPFAAVDRRANAALGTEPSTYARREEGGPPGPAPAAFGVPRAYVAACPGEGTTPICCNMPSV